MRKKRVIIAVTIIIGYILIYLAYTTLFAGDSLYDLSKVDRNDENFETLNLVFELQVEIFLEKYAKNPDEIFYKLLNESQREVTPSTGSVLDILCRKFSENGIPLNRYYSSMRETDNDILYTLKDDISKYSARVIEIINARLKLYGIPGYSVKSDRIRFININLFDVADKEEIIDLIIRTGLFEFKLVKDHEFTFSILNKLDKVNIDNDDSLTNQSLLSLVSLEKQEDNTKFFVKENKRIILFRYLNNNYLKKLIPNNLEFLFTLNPSIQNNEKWYLIYIVNKYPELTGGAIIDAEAIIDDETGAPIVHINMNPEGSNEWARITGANLGKCIAFVLDDTILSTKIISGKAMNGKVKIEELVSLKEALKYEIILSSGTYPIPLRLTDVW